MTSSWSALHLSPAKYSSGVPKSRIHASLASTEHPVLGAAQQPNVRERGTLLLYRGYNFHGILMRDIWAFDVANPVWSQWPSVPDVGAEEVAGERNICCTGSRLYRVGDGFWKVHRLDVVRDEIDDFSGKCQCGVGPKSGTWERMVEKTQEKLEVKQAGDPSKPPLTRVDDIPVPRKGYGVLPITTGTGREYLFLLLGVDGVWSMVRDVWSFQIRSEKKTPTVLKDAIRRLWGSRLVRISERKRILWKA